MPMVPPHVADLVASSGRELECADSFGIPPMISFPDDAKKVSTAYKAFGMAWKFATKKFRCSVAATCNITDFPMLKTSQIDDDLSTYSCTFVVL